MNVRDPRRLDKLSTCLFEMIPFDAVTLFDDVINDNTNITDNITNDDDTGNC